MEQNYLESIQKQFEYYKLLGDKTFLQLTDEQLLWKASSESNSIAIIVNHLHGNMKSRWTQFLTSDGEKEWRKRDAEFEKIIKNREELLQKWNDGWHCLFEALNTINKENFSTEVYIRNMGHSIIEAINRQLAHYSYHVGQIVFIGQLLKEQNWKSLSIAKGDSKRYNKEKFSKPKHKEHFTQELLDDSYYKKK